MKKKQWFKLDNAALIFPAMIRRNWNNVFRHSVTLTEEVDPAVLQQALEDLRPRFPSFFVRLRSGFFWSYLEEIHEPLTVEEEFAYPLTHMTRRQLRRCLIRVLYYRDRIAVETFHSVTDGTGGMIFLENLAAQYLELRYGITVPKTGDLRDLSQTPPEEELEDSFPKHSGNFALDERQKSVFRLHGTPQPDRFRVLTTGILPTDRLLEAAHRYHVTATAFLSAVMAHSILTMQSAERPESRYRPVRITVPVNLRKLFGSKTLRNFVLPVNIGVDPKMGSYSLSQLCDQMSHQLSAEAVPQKMAGRIAANVKPQENPVLRLAPSVIKVMAMRLVYHNRGESMGCINVSNLGNVSFPEEMSRYVKRFEFIIGVQYTYPNNCSVVSYGGRTFINMIRGIEESELERLFFSTLVEEGVPVEIESNQRSDE